VLAQPDSQPPSLRGLSVLQAFRGGTAGANPAATPTAGASNYPFPQPSPYCVSNLIALQYATLSLCAGYRFPTAVQIGTTGANPAATPQRQDSDLLRSSYSRTLTPWGKRHESSSLSAPVAGDRGTTQQWCA
jgi:hypothetical protein